MWCFDVRGLSLVNCTIRWVIVMGWGYVILVVIRGVFRC